MVCRTVVRIGKIFLYARWTFNRWIDIQSEISRSSDDISITIHHIRRSGGWCMQMTSFTYVYDRSFHMKRNRNTNNRIFPAIHIPEWLSNTIDYWGIEVLDEHQLYKNDRYGSTLDLEWDDSWWRRIAFKVLSTGKISFSIVFTSEIRIDFNRRTSSSRFLRSPSKCSIRSEECH